MEDNTIIEEFKFEKRTLITNLEFSKIISQLLKENIFKLFYHLYDKKGYLLAILKFYADEKGILLKEQLHYENFLMSKSLFYNVYTDLKDEKYIKKVGDALEDVFDIYVGGLVKEGETALGEKVGTIIMRDIPTFIGELAKKLENENMEYKEFIKNRENFLEVANKFFV